MLTTHHECAPVTVQAKTSQRSIMRIDFPTHPVGPWTPTPFWLFWKSPERRRHWQWVVDWRGCNCSFVWQYR